MTARQVQGKIARTNGKPWTQDDGEEITLYSFQLEGSNQWFRTGTNPIPAGVGQDVKFSANGANVEKGTFETTGPVVSQAPTPTTATNVSSVASPLPRRNTRSAGSKDAYWEEKAKHDAEKDARFQAVSEPRMALSVAVEAAALLIATAINKDALSFGSAAKAKKLGLLAAYTKEVALDLATFIADAPTQLAGYRANAASSTTQESAEVAE